MKKITKISIIVIFIILTIVFLLLSFSKSTDEIVARYVTYENYRYSPILLDNNIYFPSSFDEEEIKDTKIIGMLGAKDKGWFVDSFGSTGLLLVDENDKEINKIKVRDDFPMSYIKGEYLSDVNILNDNINKYENFVLCNDSDNYEEDYEIRISIDKDYLLKLVEEFGQVNINKNDYNNVDDIFYIYVDSPKHEIHNKTFDDAIVYIATIFTKNNKLYYGNLNNEIKDELYDIFMEKYMAIFK
ncbi:MAG: hypothetical protein GX275_04920 [Clostridiales bacterium]|nr:hypothetical protein [Clostridiales bacterium]